MRPAALLASVFLSLLLLNLPARAALEIPFTFRSGMIWVRVEVAGSSAPLNFLLDSGASKSIVDLAAARRLRLRLGPREHVQGVDGSCAAYAVENFSAQLASLPCPGSPLALDLSSVSARCGERLDGLLGADFFGARIVQIDFAAQRLRILQRSECPPIGPRTIALAKRNGALCVRVVVDGAASQWMRVDTGCSDALEWVVAKAEARGAALASVGTSTGCAQHIWTDIAVGPEQISSVPTGVHTRAMFPGEAGLVGNGILARYRVTLDAAGGRMFLN